MKLLLIKQTEPFRTHSLGFLSNRYTVRVNVLFIAADFTRTIVRISDH